MMIYSFIFAIQILFIGLTCAQEFDDFDGERPRDAKVFVDVHNHPKTGFSCVGKKSGEYYADPETRCAVYYVCIANQFGKLSATSFACPNGTIFSQATRVCSSYEQVSCDLATRYYTTGDLAKHESSDYEGNINNQPWQSSTTRSPVQKPPSRPRQPPPPPPEQVHTTSAKPDLREQGITRSPNRLNSLITNRRTNTRISIQNQPNVRPISFFPPTLTTTSTTTTTTTQKPRAAPQPPVEYVYDYVDYGNEAPLNPNQPSTSIKPPTVNNRK